MSNLSTSGNPPKHHLNNVLGIEPCALRIARAARAALHPQLPPKPRIISSIVAPMSTVLLIIVFIISRIIFANPGPVFFDSPEYLARLANPNFWHALTFGHLPLHAGYILLLWPIYRISPSLIIPFQIILGLLGIICFYKITQNKLAAIIVSLLPLLWISQVTIMMEAVYVPLFFISAYFLIHRRYLLFSFLFFLSTITHPGVLLWLPWLIYISPNRRLTILYSLISVFIGFISFIPKLGEHVQFSLFPFLRNILIPTLRNNTTLIAILGAISFLKILISRAGDYRPSPQGVPPRRSGEGRRGLAAVTPNGYFFVLWLAPILITNQWWDSLFFGRHALIASFGLAYLAALLIHRHKFLTAITLTYLLLSSFPALFLLRGPIPYIEEAKFAALLPPGGIYVTSHFARPQLEGAYRGTTIFVNEPGWTSFPATVSALYISPSAKTDPYGLYSGPYLHLLSVSPDVYYSPRRLDYHDPITQLWFFFSSRFTF